MWMGDDNVLGAAQARWAKWSKYLVDDGQKRSRTFGDDTSPPDRLSPVVSGIPSMSKLRLSLYFPPRHVITRRLTSFSRRNSHEHADSSSGPKGNFIFKKIFITNCGER